MSRDDDAGGSPQADIRVFGDVCLHVVIAGAGDGAFSAGTIVLAPGGSAAMVAQQVAALGRPVAMSGVSGDDDLGRWLRTEIEQQGVVTDHWAAVPGVTARVAVLVDPADAEHRLVVDQGQVDRPGEAIVDAGGLAAAGAGTMCYVPGFPAYDAVRTSLVACGARVVCDFGFRPWLVDLATMRENVLPRLSGVDLAVCSGAQFSDATNRDFATACLDHGTANVVISLGARGSLAKAGDACGAATYLPAFPVRAASTLGAGDSLVAGLLVARARGESLVTACRFGQAVAAAKITRLAAPAATAAVDELLARA